MSAGSEVAAPAASASRWRGVLRAFGTPSALTLCVFGFACGLPFLLVGYTMSIWLREGGTTLAVIGLISYAKFFYVFKFLWAPLLDRYQLPVFRRLGRRRGWLFAAQLLLAVALAGMGLLGPDGHLPLFIGFIALAALAGATQDTMVDAYRIEIAPVEAQGALAATYTLGYRLGLIVSGAGALYLADFSGWATTYVVMAGLLGIAATATLLAREPVPSEAMRAHSAIRSGLFAAYVHPFANFFRRHGVTMAIVLLAFVGLYKLPDQMLGVVAGPFYIDTGLTKSEIATVSKIFGIWVGIAGAFAGGIAVAAAGLRGPLLVAALGVALSNLLFVLMSMYPGELWAFVLTICGDNFSQGFAGVVLVAFMATLVDQRFTATQFALLGSLANLPGLVIGGVSGFIVEASSYTAFFVFSSLSIIPTLIVMLWLWPRLGPAPKT